MKLIDILKEKVIKEDRDSNTPVNVLAIIKKKHGNKAAEAFENTFIDGLGWDNQDFEALKLVFIEVKNILKSGLVKGAQKKDLKLNWDYLEDYIYEEENPNWGKTKESKMNELGNPQFSSKGKAVLSGSPLDGGTDSQGNAYDPYKVEFDIDTCRIIQGRNVIEISRKASKELAKEIRDSFF